MPKLHKSEKIIIVGAGVYGLSTSLALLEDGFTNVHIFDKNDYIKQKYDYFLGCDSASSDMNKIFRAAYGEQVHYQEMALKSRGTFLKWNLMIEKENWEGGDPVFINTGLVSLSDQKELPSFEKITLDKMGSDAIHVASPGAQSLISQRGLPKYAADPFMAKERGQVLQGILDTTGGVMIADKMCRWVLEMCRRVGGDHFHTHLGNKIGEVKQLLVEYNKTTGCKKCVGIETLDGNLHFSEVTVVLCGAWTASVVPEAGEKVEATGGTVALIKLETEELKERFKPANFPVWTYKMRDGVLGGLYGFPAQNGYLKIGYRGLKWINPSGKINSKVLTAYTETPQTNVPAFGLRVIKNFIRENLPQISKIDRTRLCWYSDSEDNDFLISYCPHYEDNSLFVGAGDSGHAFMMFGSLGTIIKDIILDQADPFLKQLFSWSRDRESLNPINKGLNDPRALQNITMASPNDWIINPAKF